MKAFILRYILPELWRIRGRAALACLLVLVTTATGVAAVEAVRLALQAIRLALTGEAPQGLLADLAAFGLETPKALFWACGLAALVVPLLTWLGVYVQSVVFEWVSISIIRDLRLALYRRILDYPYVRLQEMSIGAMLKRVVQDTIYVREVVMGAGLMRLADLLMMLALLVYLAVLQPMLAGVTILALALYFAGALLSARIAKGRLRARDGSYEQLNGKVEQGLNRVVDIRVNRREASEAEAIAGVADHDARANLTCASWLLIDRSLTGVLAAIGPIAVLFVGGLMVFGGSLDLETLMAFVGTSSLLYKPVDNLSAIPITLQRAGVAVDNMSAILSAPVEEGGGGASAAPADPSAPAVRCAGASFGYPDSELEIAFEDLRVERGEKVALVGPSGCGKSTLFRLLFGLLRGYGGSLQVNGHEVSGLSLAALRGSVAFMLQQTMVLPDTIRANVAYGAGSDASPDDEAVWVALERAGLAAEIRARPKGLDTTVDLMAETLSGGQKRRLCLARALISQPDLLLLDEPLTGVGATERGQIIQTLTRSLKGVGLILCTHQQDLLRYVNRVCFLGVSQDGGRARTAVVATGSHGELLASCPAYAAMFDEASDEGAGGGA